MLLQGKVAIVTGSAVGIGREIAIAFGREGASVVVNCSKSAAEANATARAVEGAGGHALALSGNVAMDADARQ